MNNIKRGEMFYISRGGVSYNGSEQHSDRPAVVVSNDKNNENSNVVEVVYMTTQPKTDLPTHVTVRSTGRPSTVLCEQVYSVSTERIGTYIGECSDKEMENIDIALMISLQLDGNMKTSKKYNETIKEQQEEIDLYRKKIQAMQEALKEKENEKPEITASSEETIRLQTERDTYKTMYEQLLNRLVNGEQHEQKHIKGRIYQCENQGCEIHRSEYQDGGQQSAGNHHQSEREFRCEI